MRGSLNHMLGATAALLLSTSALNSSAASLSFNGYFAGMSKTQADEVGVENCREGASISEYTDAIYCDIPARNRRFGELTASKATLEFLGPKHDSVNQIRLEFVTPVESVKSAMVASYGAARYDGQTYSWARGSETVNLNILSRLQAISYITFDYEVSVEKARANALKLEALKKQAVKNF